MFKYSRKRQAQKRKTIKKLVQLYRKPHELYETFRKYGEEETQGKEIL
tara:strand:+ start:422 stop:565 length:144 start_codon:yes stop_codon:yes gene_type:complete